MRKTKIVATISDQRCDKEFITSLFNAGMNVARINTAHVNTESAKMMIRNIRDVSNSIAILIDTKGPEIRTCKTQNQVDVVKGQEVVFSFSKIKTDLQNVCVNYKEFVHALNEGDNILIDDGEIKCTVLKKHKDHLLCKVENSGTIKNNKSVNIPGVEVKLPSISDKDKEFIDFACENEIDFIAHSFVRNKQDVLEVQKLLDAKGSQIKIIAKIENLAGVNNIDEILEVAYGIMVARGDLGIELPAERIPTVQRNPPTDCKTVEFFC